MRYDPFSRATEGDDWGILDVSSREGIIVILAVINALLWVSSSDERLGRALEALAKLTVGRSS